METTSFVDGIHKASSPVFTIEAPENLNRSLGYQITADRNYGTLVNSPNVNVVISMFDESGKRLEGPDYNMVFGIALGADGEDLIRRADSGDTRVWALDETKNSDIDILRTAGKGSELNLAQIEALRRLLNIDNY